MDITFCFGGGGCSGQWFSYIFFFFGISVEISGGGREKEKLANQQHNKQIKKKTHKKNFFFFLERSGERYDVAYFCIWDYVFMGKDKA